MKLRRNLPGWIDRYRLPLWWALFIPLFTLVLLLGWKELQVAPGLPADFSISFFDKVLGAPPVIMLARVALLATGVVVIMIALFLPVFQVGKKGIQWSRELEEELARTSGEVTAEEIEELVREESLRWAVVYRWLKLREEEQEPAALLRELPALVREFFPGYQLSLSLEEEGRRWALLYHLWPWLVPEKKITPEETILGLNVVLNEKVRLELLIYAGGQKGFSIIDEGFLLVLGEIFLWLLMETGEPVPDRTAAFFYRAGLTGKTAEV